MREVAGAYNREVQRIDETTLRSVLCCVAGVAVVGVLLISNPYVAAAILASAAIGGTAFAWRAPEIHAELRVPLVDAWHAAIFAMNDRGFSYGRGTWRTATGARVGGRRAVIVIESHTGNVTRVRVRVGRFRTAPNRRRAMLLLESLERHLT